MNASQVKDLSDDELGQKLVDLKKEAFNLRFQKATGQLENTSRFNEIRRDVARVKTVINERQRAQAQDAS